MKSHSVDIADQNPESDNLLFWPLGQEVFIRLVRMLFDRSPKIPDPDNPTIDQLKEALQPLNKIDWRLHSSPWRYLLLIGEIKINDKGNQYTSWKMRQNTVKEAKALSLEILNWLFGINTLNKEQLDLLKIDWQNRLIPAQTDADENDMWDELMEKKREIDQLI